MPQGFSANIVNPFVVPGIRKVNIDSNLKPDYSFDSYVEGESNKFAATVARSIAKRPGATAFNPLFLYGGYGVGKTHLGQAVGLEVKISFRIKWFFIYLQKNSSSSLFLLQKHINRQNLPISIKW
jgi:chromosomal replication initiator protein